MTVWVRGRVQGVGFRWWTRARALELGLAGSAANLDDGRVEVVAEGPRASCLALLELLREQPSTRRRPGSVQAVVERWSDPRGTGPGFVER
ncbi:MAG: acylphosphatase [Motilibacteraceae bacterium]